MEKSGISKLLVVNSDGKAYSKYPVMYGYLSVPVFKLVNSLYGINYLTEEQVFNSRYVQFVGKINAAVFVGFAMVIFYALAMRLFRNAKLAIYLTSVLLLCTGVFSMAAQTNWQHSFSLFFTILSVYLCVRWPNTPLGIGLAGVLVGFAAGLRMSNAFYFLYGASLLWLLRESTDVKHRVKNMFEFAFCFIIGLLPHLLLSYRENIPSGYVYDFERTWETLGFTSTIQNMYALLFSYNYGLFIYSPILLFSIFTLILFAKKKLKNISQLDATHIWSSALVMLMFLIFAGMWWVWTGGAALDARLLIETLPLYVLLLGYFVRQYWKNRIVQFLVVLFTLWSLFTHLLSTYSLDFTWNDKYLGRTYHSQQKSAWFSEPTFLEYMASKRQIKLEYLYRSGNEMKVRSILLGYGLRTGVRVVQDVTVTDLVLEQN